ncbi:hypothetical protein HPB50_013331 [Hyalomma asiaticum]|uniref:Uncharacterized protein n=1 Tax=Hyalomma asiaticum TaxID=266040 RepID=A0ACB7RLP5_HYAAI|nr:hypothetical protein HPB50_013331 [Hyalomma asiaticum]
MAGSTVPQDITGVLRGRCKECDCNGFKRLVDLVGHDKVPVGWCILCGHSPVSHGALVNLCEGAQEDMKWETKRDRTVQILDSERGWLALESEVRFEANFGGMEAKLQDIRNTLGRTSFIEIDAYL